MPFPYQFGRLTVRDTYAIHDLANLPEGIAISSPLCYTVVKEHIERKPFAYTVKCTVKKQAIAFRLYRYYIRDVLLCQGENENLGEKFYEYH